MLRFAFSSLILASVLLPMSTAQDKGSPKKTPTKNTDGPKTVDEIIPGDVEIHFLNGSKVRAIILSEKLEIETIYGKLTVPIQDVMAIEFGLHFPEGAAAKIDTAVQRLGHSDFREREKAVKALVDLGPYSYAAVVKATRAKDSEVANRAKDLLTKLQAKHPKKDLRTSPDDKIVTPTQTIVGRILTSTVKTRAEYFGEVDHKLANMRTLRAFQAPGVDIDVSVDGGKYAMAGQWMDSGYQVDGKASFVVSAKGMIDQWPQSPGQYMSGPNGGQGNRFGGPGGGMIMKGQKVIGNVQPQLYGGMLLGKIGENGEAFVIGDRHEIRPETEGKLYLHIGPSPWGCPSAGSYDVKIARKND